MNELNLPICYLPSGRPAPAVLTAEEAVELLRLDGDGQRALKYWRDMGELVGIRLGRRVRYRLSDVLDFLSKKAEKTGVSAQVAEGKRAENVIIRAKRA